MAICPGIKVQKLPVDYFTLMSRQVGLNQQTVRQLRQLCKTHNLVQRGLKADIIERLHTATGLPKGGIAAKPYWFWWDEATGQGDHKLFYVCKCGCATDLTKFNARSDGLVFPSIECGNRQCLWHIWVKMENYDGGKTLESQSGAYKDEYYWPSWGYGPPLL